MGKPALFLAGVLPPKACTAVQCVPHMHQGTAACTNTPDDAAICRSSESFAASDIDTGGHSSVTTVLSSAGAGAADHQQSSCPSSNSGPRDGQHVTAESAPQDFDELDTILNLLQGAELRSSPGGQLKPLWGELHHVSSAGSKDTGSNVCNDERDSGASLDVFLCPASQDSSSTRTKQSRLPSNVRHHQ